MSVKLEVKDVEELEAKIDGLSSICDKGKAEFKSIIESFGVKFKDKMPTPKAGQVWFYDNNIGNALEARLLIGLGQSIVNIVDLGGFIMFTRKDSSYTTLDYLKLHNYVFGYNSLKEYYQTLLKEEK